MLPTTWSTSLQHSCHLSGDRTGTPPASITSPLSPMSLFPTSPTLASTPNPLPYMRKSCTWSLSRLGIMKTGSGLLPRSSTSRLPLSRGVGLYQHSPPPSTISNPTLSGITYNCPPQMAHVSNPPPATMYSMGAPSVGNITVNTVSYPWPAGQPPPLISSISSTERGEVFYRPTD
jgi:hypothetical protein